MHEFERLITKDGFISIIKHNRAGRVMQMAVLLNEFDKVCGIRTFWDLQQNQSIQQNEEWQDKMLQLEERVSEKDEYVSISSFHHIILSKKQI